jgi:hypothetical protein
MTRAIRADSTAAIRLGIATVELFYIKLGRTECVAGAGLCAFGTEIRFVGSVAAPLTQTAPEVAPEPK